MRREEDCVGKRAMEIVVVHVRWHVRIWLNNTIADHR